MILANYQFNYRLISNIDKPVIAFLHGFMGNVDEFNLVIKSLGDSFSYLTIDLPGHGKTQVLGKDEYYTIINIAQALINLLDKLEIPKCYLVGYSMGGRLALYLTLHFPKYFDRVVLESTSPGLATETERLVRVKHDAEIVTKLGKITTESDFLEFLSHWYQQKIFGNIHKHSEFRHMLNSRLSNQPLELVKSLQYMGVASQPSLWDKLEDNQVPLLLLVGEYDDKFIEINRKIIKISQVSQLKIISNSAHNIHMENVSEFTENIKEFWLSGKN